MKFILAGLTTFSGVVGFVIFAWFIGVLLMAFF